MEQINPEDFTLNIRAPDVNFVNHDSSDLQDVTSEIFKPKEGVKITRVCDEDGTVILEDPRSFIRVAFVHKDNRPNLVSVEITKYEARLFVKSKDEWTQVTPLDFEIEFVDLFLPPFPTFHCDFEIKNPLIRYALGV